LGASEAWIGVRGSVKWYGNEQSVNWYGMSVNWYDVETNVTGREYGSMLTTQSNSLR